MYIFSKITRTQLTQNTRNTMLAKSDTPHTTRSRLLQQVSLSVFFWKMVYPFAKTHTDCNATLRLSSASILFFKILCLFLSIPYVIPTPRIHNNPAHYALLYYESNQFANAIQMHSTHSSPKHIHLCNTTHYKHVTDKQNKSAIRIETRHRIIL